MIASKKVKEDCATREVTSAQAYHLAKDREEWSKLLFRPPKSSMDTDMNSQALSQVSHFCELILLAILLTMSIEYFNFC